MKVFNIVAANLECITDFLPRNLNYCLAEYLKNICNENIFGTHLLKEKWATQWNKVTYICL